MNNDAIGDWLTRNKRSAIYLCRLTGINAPLMSRIVNNLLPVSLESALRIDRATHGELAAELIVTNAEHAQLIIHIRGHQ